MGQAWSSLWDVRLPFNCYETCHTWTPHCHRAWLELFVSAIASTLPLHVFFYLVSALMSSKSTASWKEQLRGVLKNSVRSSLSIAYCFFFLAAFNCSSRAFLGHFSPGSVLVSTLAAVYLGIKLEDPRRIRSLLLSMLRLAAEVGLETLKQAGIVADGFENAQASVFAFGLAGYLWLSRGSKGDITNWAIRVLLGDKPVLCNHSILDDDKNHLGRTFLRCLASALGRFILLGGVASVASLALSWGREVNPRPGLFLGSLSALYGLTCCSLRLVWPSQPWHSVVAALVAGQSLALWPSPRLALYLVCKCLEAAYHRGEESGLLPKAPNGASAVLFAICCGVLLTTGVLQPHLVRPSYRAFIDRLAGHRMRFINIPAIATLGFGTSDLVPGGAQVPPLDPKFLSRKYTEHLWVWSI